MIEWTSALEVNVQVLDEQHRALAGLLDKIEDLLRQKSDRAEIEKAMAEFAHHTKLHFQAEERLMAEHDYPGRHNHIDVMHDHLLEELAKLRLDLHSGTLHLNARTLRFLRDWMVSHIQADKELGAFLNSKGVR
ncbi:MAG: hemerythrin family protein [Betaproteobacteria bacterium]|nr:hemerythrin family protein [Betaproteobacteria bacterium]